MSLVTSMMTESTKKNGSCAGQRPNLVSSNYYLWHPRFAAWDSSVNSKIYRLHNKKPTLRLLNFMSTNLRIQSTKPKMMRIKISQSLNARFVCKNLKLGKISWFFSVMRSTTFTSNVAKIGWWGSLSAHCVERASNHKWNSSTQIWQTQESGWYKHSFQKLCTDSYTIPAFKFADKTS